MTDESKRAGRDLSKLPRWVRQEIERLWKEVAHWKNQALSAADTNPESTDTRLLNYEGATPELRGLPPGAHVRFTIPSGEIDCYVRDGEVTVRGVGYDAGRLTISPHTANVVAVQVLP